MQDVVGWEGTTSNGASKNINTRF